MVLENITNFDFSQLDSPDFKEDSVREILILPLLFALGYQNQQIVRSKTLQHPFLKIGSKKRPINLIPDYLLKVEDSYAWVLDAKAPHENIKNGDNIEQVFSYSIHPEVRTKFFALCNGKAFSLFRQDVQEPILYFELANIFDYWEQLSGYLSPSSFQTGKTISYEKIKKSPEKFNYLERPLLEEITPKRQSTRRHKGVHGYFTRQVWNIVQEYIRNFSQKGDLVLDPFGGSGVTAIEAMMTDRHAIHLDLNPMSFFLVKSLTTPVDLLQLQDSFERIKDAYEIIIGSFKNQAIFIKNALASYPYPKGIKLPKGSDVKMIQELFTRKQLAHLSLLKHLIKAEKDKAIKQVLLLTFSSALYKLNRTYQEPKNISDGGGNSGIFAYYRYRVAPRPADVNIWDCFENRFKKIVAAKKEIEDKINSETIKNLQILKGTATNLSFLKKESVDYIYTDPPYGKKIPYLDLSIMWNAWLDLEVTEEDYALEAIEGGEHEKSKEDYNILISKSIQEMYRVLKFERWMSFVFAHKDPEFWHLIVETAEKCGFEYAGAVAQKNGQTSFKKRQNPFTVLSGQLIINFKKVRKPRYIMKAALGMEISDIVIQTIEGTIAKYNGATLEQLNDELIIRGLELGFLDLLQKEYKDLTPILLEQFDFDDKTELFTLKKNSKFKTHIDVKLRVKYYLISYLRRLELSKKYPTFDEIVLHIMPLLKNGITPEEQTILNVLEDIAIPKNNGCWKLKIIGQQTLME